MPVINLLNQAYQSKSVDQNAAQLINMYLEEDQNRGKYPLIALPTPGFGTAFSTLASPVRALFTEHNSCYAVGGNTFYSIASNGTATSLGTLNTSSGFCQIAGINDQIMIIDGTNGYLYKITANTFAQISDVDFTQTATSLTAQDEYFLVTESANSQVWQISNISDGTTWDALNFASTTGNQNNLVACISLQRQIWLFSTQTTEIWYNAGAVNFPFLRRPDAYIQYGLAAKQSLALGDNTLFLLGQSSTGGVVVLRMNGYTPMKISTRAIDNLINSYTTISDAVAFLYQQEGHEFYVLTFPTQGVTWVYDLTTQAWHQRQSLISAAQTRWVANCYTYCYGKQLIGDYQSGNVYSLSTTTYQENGSAITRTLTSNPFYAAGDYLYLDRLQVDFDTTPGTDLSQINLYCSRDGGNTFGSAKAASPQQTSLGWRVYWLRMGAARSYVLRLTTTLNGKYIILGAIATIRPGTPV